MANIKMKQWRPRPRDVHSDTPVRLDASAAFKHPITVLTTKREVARIIQKLRLEKKEFRTALSNEKFRNCCVADVQDPQSESFQKFCGDVIVFFAVRFVIDGTQIPVLV